MPKNVLFVSHYPHFRMGGQKSMLALIENLNRQNVNPYVLAPESSELLDKAKSLNCNTFAIELFPLKPKNLFKIISLIKKIIKIIKENKIDIIHTDTERDALVFGFAKKFTNAKMIWHSRLARPDKTDNLITKWADGVILIANDIQRRFSNFSEIEHKTRTIYNGVFCDIFCPTDKLQIRNELNLPENKFIVSFIGQINKGKGVYDFIESANYLKQNGTDNFLYLLIGKANNDEDYARINNFIDENNLQNNLKIIEHQKEIHKWMQASDIVILPSYEGIEGMGRVLIEGMACGKPVIGTNISGIREAISEDTGILVEQNSPRQIANAVSKFMNDEKMYSEFAKSARKRALTLFDIKKHAENVESFYDFILK